VTDRTYEHKTERGELRIWLAAPSVAVFKYKGHADASYVDFLEGVIEELFGSQSGLHFLVDCEEQTGFDAGFRRRITEWGKRYEPRTRTYCLFVRSRLVAFGISLAGVIVGGKTQVCTTRTAFRSKLEGAVRQSLDDAPHTP
jgi:hypothetical protein